jgi:biopolymer transport protein ExbD
MKSWIDSMAPRLIRQAARAAPGDLADRLQEEWLADLADRPRRMSRLRFALGCYWAATMISHDDCTVSVVPNSSPTWNHAMTACAHPGSRLFPRRNASAASGPVMCDINITPLIDVLLVLLVTLIVSLPVMTHAVKLDFPQPANSVGMTPPEVVNLDIEFDGRMEWNGAAVAGLSQLESYLRAAAQTDPQPQIHLHPDRHVKYDFVARVLAAAQRNRLRKIGFVNTGEFEH